MAHDTELEAKIDYLSLNWPGFGKKRMFGGMAYLLHGNMAFAIWKDRLVVRCGADAYAGCLARPGAQEFAITGKAMNGWVMVAPDGCANEADLAGWLERGRDFAAGLPPK